MKDMIVFAEDFGGLPSSSQHLIKRLAKERQVLWINSIGLRQPKLCWQDVRRVCHKLLRPLMGKRSQQKRYDVSSDSAQIEQMNVWTIPAPNSRVARYIAQQMILAQLRPVLKKKQLNEPLLWLSLPTAVDLCGKLGESAVMYYCGDDFGALAGVDHQVVLKHEQRLADKAEAILVASEKLGMKFPQWKTYYLPHGVDIDLFTTPTEKAIDFPPQTSPKRPVAGFYGSLSQWLDYGLLNQVIAALPEWDFVFIGPQDAAAEKLIRLSNVYCLGPRAHHLLPSYSQHWDVSMLPFVNNGQINACNPLKLLEYIACGRPIVTTDFPALSPYRRYVSCVQNAQAFAQALQNAVGQEAIPKQVIAAESWDERTRFLNQLMERL